MFEEKKGREKHMLGMRKKPTGKAPWAIMLSVYKALTFVFIKAHGPGEYMFILQMRKGFRVELLQDFTG